MPERRRVAFIAGLTGLAVGLLWWLTACEDAEGLIWRHYREGVFDANVLITCGALAAGHILRSAAGVRIRAFQIASVLAATVIVAGLLELPALFARVDYGSMFGVRQGDAFWQIAFGINRYDPELISIHPPHSRHTGTVKGTFAYLGIPSPVLRDFDVTYDARGFRNDADLTRADVVLLGDSFVEGAETPQASTVTAHLGRLLGVTAANLGQSGYGPQQELIVLRRYALPLGPKVIVWFFYGGNDLGNAMTYEARRRHAALRLAPTWPSRSFVRNALLAFGRRTTPERSRPTEVARRRSAVFTHADGTTETMYFETRAAEGEPHAWEVTFEGLRAAQAEMKATATMLLVAYIPSKQFVYRDVVRWTVPEVGAAIRPDTTGVLLGDWCRSQGIAFLDFTEPFTEQAGRGESSYLADDDHWNPAGHRIAAERVAAEIRRMAR